MRKHLTRSQAYEQSENVGRNDSDNPTLGDVIKEQPIVAVLIALGIGYLLGRLTA